MGAGRRVEDTTWNLFIGNVTYCVQNSLDIVPRFGHEVADFAYKCTDVYMPEDEQGPLWNNVELGIQWPIADPLLSAKDRGFPTLKKVPPHDLPA